MDWFSISISVGVTAIVFIALQVRRGAPTDLLFVAALMVITLTGVISPEAALSGFANSAVLTIAGLLIVAAALRATGVLDWVGRWLLGGARSEAAALNRIIPAVAATSAFVLNTALVAMLMPVLIDWSRRHRISPSKLLIPLSYLTILGGVCTLIGTSTTLVVNGELRRFEQKRIVQESAENMAEVDSQTIRKQTNVSNRKRIVPLGMFELGLVGLPCALVGMLYLRLLGPRLLPNRTDMLEQLGEQRREYLLEMLVQESCPLIGQTVEQAGLRHLPGLFLIEIDRNNEVLTPVAPEDKLFSGDRLIFTGIVSTIVDLQKVPGLVPAADHTFEFHPREQSQRRLTEVVLSRSSPLIGQTVREGDFRKRYNAAVVAVHRNGVRLTNKIGDIRLEPGDTLLLQTRSGFVSTFRNRREFYLVSNVEGSRGRLHHKAGLCGGLTLLLIMWLVAGSIMQSVGQQALAGITSTAIAALTIACTMIVSRCIRMSDARAAIDLQMLVTIAAALGLGRGLYESGAAELAASTLVRQLGGNPYLLLISLYLLTVLLTESLSNNAVAAMLLPVAIVTAEVGGFDSRPFVIAITLAASLSFMTPIGYQTNLMVMGPGGYRTSDYLRCGVPLALLVGVTALVLIPNIWSF